MSLNGAVTSSTTVLPSGLTSVRTARRLYQGTDPEDLLAFTEYTDEKIINGRTWRTRYTRNDRTFVQTSPRGRDVTRIIDLLGRTVQTQTEEPLGLAEGLPTIECCADPVAVLFDHRIFRHELLDEFVPTLASYALSSC